MLLFIGQQAPLGFLAGEVDGGTLLVLPLIRAVSVNPRLPGHGRSLAAHRQIMPASRMRGRDTGDPAPFRDHILSFQRMALLLARIVLLLDGAVPGAVDRLLRAINDQRLRLLSAQARLAFDAQGGFRDRLQPLDGTADHTAIDTVKEADELLGDVTAIVDQQDQQVILQEAGLEGPAGFELAALHPPPRRLQTLQHLAGHRDLNAGQTAKARAGPEPGTGKGMAHRLMPP